MHTFAPSIADNIIVEAYQARLAQLVLPTLPPGVPYRRLDVFTGFGASIRIDEQSRCGLAGLGRWLAARHAQAASTHCVVSWAVYIAPYLCIGTNVEPRHARDLALNAVEVVGDAWLAAACVRFWLRSRGHQPPPHWTMLQKMVADRPDLPFVGVEEAAKRGYVPPVWFSATNN